MQRSRNTDVGYFSRVVFRRRMKLLGFDGSSTQLFEGLLAKASDSKVWVNSLGFVVVTCLSIAIVEGGSASMMSQGGGERAWCVCVFDGACRRV